LGFSIAPPFIASIYLARVLDLSEFGLFSILYAAHTVAFSFFHGVVIEAFLVLSSGRYIEDSLYRNLAYRLVLLFILLLTVIFLAIYTMVSIVDFWQILSLLYASILINVAYFIRRTLHIDGQADVGAVFSGVMFLMFCLLLWAFHYKEMASITSTFVAFGTSNLICSLIFYRRMNISLQSINYRNSVSRLKAHIKYAKWVLLSAFVIQGASQGYIWIIGVELSLADLGVYRAIFTIVMPIALVCTGISLTCVPILSAHYASGDIIGFRKCFRNVMFFSIGVAFLLYTVIWFFGGWLLDIVYAKKFSEYTEMLNILALGAIATILANPFNDYSKATERPSRVLAAYVAAAITTFTIGYYIIIKFTLLGAAWGFVLTNISFGLVLLIYYLVDQYAPVKAQFKAKKH